MYKHILSRVSKDGQQHYNFNSLILCLKHYRGEVSMEDRKLVISRLKEDYFRGQENLKGRVSSQMLELLKNNFLSSEAQYLNEMIISEPSYEFQWSLSS